jgi:hypothetical protein
MQMHRLMTTPSMDRVTAKTIAASQFANQQQQQSHDTGDHAKERQQQQEQQQRQM